MACLSHSVAPNALRVRTYTAAIQVIQNEPQRRRRLWKNRNYLYSDLKKLGFELTDTQSPILPIIVKSQETALKMSQALYEAGIYIPAIRPPTVPKDSSRLRLTISSEHSNDQLEKVIKAFGILKKKFF